MEERDRSGRFAAEHSDASILAAVRAHEPAATSEVAGEVGMTRQGADRRLRRLREGGRVSSKKIGASLVWFAPADAAGDRANDVVEGGAAATAPAAPQDADDPVADVDLPGKTETKVANRRAALRTIYDYLREHGKGRKSEFLELVDLDDVDYGSLESFWSNCIKDRKALSSLPGVESPGEGGHTWRYEE